MPDTPTVPTPPSSSRRRWPWLLALALAAGAAWWWLARPAPTPGAPPASAARGAGARPGGPGAFGGGPNAAVPVTAVAARAEDVDVYVKALGTVTSLGTVTVRSRVEGELQKLFFTEGQQVRAGDPLAQIDPRSYEVQLAQAEGALQQNRAQLDNARRDLERYQTLYGQESIARQQVDTQAALVRQYEGTLKSNQAAVDNARLQLSYTRVTAPISGRLGLRQVDTGNLVRASDANGIVVITQTRPISVVFAIPEPELPAVLAARRPGSRMAVLAYDRADTRVIARGELTTIDNQIDTTTGTIKLRATFANDDDALFPNQFVNARLHVSTLKDALVIPAAAVQRGTPGTFVYVVDADGTARLRVIKTRVQDGERITVTDGLTAGERVITEGVDRLRDGARVDAGPRAPDAATAGAAQGGNRPAQRQRPRAQ